MLGRFPLVLFRHRRKIRDLRLDMGNSRESLLRDLRQLRLLVDALPKQLRDFIQGGDDVIGHVELQWSTVVSKVLNSARASASTTATSGVSPAKSLTASIDSQLVS